MILSNVVFPLPDFPTTARTSPLFTFIERSWRAATSSSPLLKILKTDSTMTIFWDRSYNDLNRPSSSESDGTVLISYPHIINLLPSHLRRWFGIYFPKVKVYQLLSIQMTGLRSIIYLITQLLFQLGLEKKN